MKKKKSLNFRLFAYSQQSTKNILINDKGDIRCRHANNNLQNIKLYYHNSSLAYILTDVW